MPLILTPLRILTALLAASLLLSAAVSTASATRLSVSNQNIRATWNSLEFASELVTLRCQLTLEGSFHTRTIAKVRESLIGAITMARFKEEACTNGSFRAQAVPWHITYESFAGTLPNITAVNLLLSRFRFQLNVPGICTAEYGTATDNITGAAVVGAGRAITGLGFVEGRNTANRFAGTGLCPPSARLKGSEGRVTLPGATTLITVTLI
jgi:hypothetical protein